MTNSTAPKIGVFPSPTNAMGLRNAATEKTNNSAIVPSTNSNAIPAVAYQNLKSATESNIARIEATNGVA